LVKNVSLTEIRLLNRYYVSIASIPFLPRFCQQKIFRKWISLIVFFSLLRIKTLIHEFAAKWLQIVIFSAGKWKKNKHFLY